MLQVTATDADDPTYGNSARIVYSILQGQPYFSVDPKTGEAITACLGTDAPAKMGSITKNGSTTSFAISFVVLRK